MKITFRNPCISKSIIKQALLLAFSIIYIALNGCAHLDQTEKSNSVKFDNKDPQSSATDEKIPSDLARIIIIRARTWDQDINPMLSVVRPIYVGLNDKMVSIMPLGSHTSIFVEPGKHTAKFYNVALHLDMSPFNRRDLKFDAAAGQTIYLVHGINALPGLGRVSDIEGKRYIDRTRSVPLIHRPNTTNSFEEALKRDSFVQKLRGSTQDISAAVLSLFPSHDQVTSFLGEVAKIAAIGVIVVGGIAIVAASSAGEHSAVTHYTPQQNRTNIENQPPAVISSATAGENIYASTSMLKFARGSMDLIREGKNVTIINQNTGTKYSVEGNRITGTDGSRYKIIGNQIISIGSGGSYFISGNSLYSNDGTHCNLIGSNFFCKTPQQR